MSRASWMLAGAALAIVGFCLLSTAIGVGWWFGFVRQPAAPAVPSGLQAQAESWNWQRLQDHLANHGLKTYRGQGPTGMVFILQGNGPPMSPAAVGDLEGSVFVAKEVFRVRDLGSAAQAKREAARIRDVEQSESLVWSKFLIEAHPETLSWLRDALR